TDFVAKDDNFRAFAQAVTDTVAQHHPDSVEALKALPLGGGTGSVEEAREALIGKIGEKIDIRRFSSLEGGTQGRVSAYLHGARIGVLVGTTGGRADLGKDIAMHVAASEPLCVSKDQVPEEILDKEREIYTAQAQESGKPAQIMEKMVEGRIQKYLNEITLLGQPFVKEPDKSVEKLLKDESAEVNGFIRYEVGEGLERREDDFVAEVMAQAKGG
ncbi:MAG: translation elongation factor Ts, partial [Gammaproteobacteria bacterium]|nr:translation elongation factor Ts [Gammaproteobacteria bacterium]